MGREGVGSVHCQKNIAKQRKQGDDKRRRQNSSGYYAQLVGVRRKTQVAIDIWRISDGGIVGWVPGYVSNSQRNVEKCFAEKTERYECDRQLKAPQVPAQRFHRLVNRRCNGEIFDAT